MIRLCRAVAARLAAQLPAATVRGPAFVPRYDRKTMSGLYVWVFPVSDKEAGKLDKLSDQMGPRIAVVCAEKCADVRDSDSPEPVPDEWVCERINTVETEVFDVLRQERTDIEDQVITGVWPESADWVQVFDPELLSGDRVFWSEIEVEYGFPS